jgi:GNAT superfamily N-acetyltransferase
MTNATQDRAIRDDAPVGADELAGLVAAAIITPVPMIPPPFGSGRRMKEVAGPASDRVRELPAALDAHDPHHYLAFRSARPDRQNRGIGSALLDRHHARLDRAGLPAYLEANDHRYRDLHPRHGYPRRPVNQVPGGPLLWSKRRSPMA